MAEEVWTDPQFHGSHIVFGFEFENVLLFLRANCLLEAKYCQKCGDRLQQNVSEREASVDELIERYFHRGYPYQAIVGLLEKQDGVQMHVRTLKRKLEDLDLKRKAANHDEDILWELIKQEMQ